MRNLQKRRNGWYYVRGIVNGRRIQQALNTRDKDVATKRARLALDQAESGKWLDVERLRTKNGYATIAEILRVYDAKAAAVQDLRESTRKGVARQILNVLHVAGGHGPDASAAVLTEELADAYRNAMLADHQQDVRRRRTIKSTLRQAKSLFAGWTRAEYARANLHLPDLSGFLRGGGLAVKPVQYTLPPQELIDRTIRLARADLRETQPDVYQAFLLCYDLALRAGESAACRWDWFRETTGQRVLVIEARDGFQPKGAARTVPVSPEVWQHLQVARKAGSQYVLPADTPTAREDIIKRNLAAWMRGIGWDRAQWPKAAHELRKLMGSRWYTLLRPEVAKEWLGHRQLATTCQYYARLTKHPEPLKMD